MPPLQSYQLARASSAGTFMSYMFATLRVSALNASLRDDEAARSHPADTHIPEIYEIHQTQFAACKNVSALP